MTDADQSSFLEAITPVPIRAGYRLLRLEIKNFGGYHGPASVFHCDLEGAVFSGDNGAGKSTAIDAYRMLFRTQPRFNSATDGAKDRTVETYYIGQYGKKDSSGRSLPLKLREHGIRKGFMAICGVFRTDSGDTFSALRMGFFPRKGESAEWRLVTAAGDISIERDFPEWPTKGACSRAAEALGGELHATYRDFFAAIGHAFGIENPDEAAEAFRFIDDSIGIKKLGSIASFARDHIFPRNSLEQSADGAIAAFEEVQQSTRRIQRTREMIKALKETTRKFVFYENAVAAHAETNLRRLRFAQFAQTTMLCKSGRILRRATDKHARIEAALAKATAEIHSAEAEVRAIDLKMSEKGFDKVNDLKDQKQALLVRIGSLDARLRTIAANFDEAGMNFDGSSARAFDASFAKVMARISELDAKIAENRTGERDADHEVRLADAARQQAAGKLEELLSNKSALDTRLIRARDAIARELGIRSDDLPFLAELAQVREADQEWEGVANRVLGGAGTEILIEREHLSAARAFVDGRHMGARVVLNDVADLDQAGAEDLHAHALARKIEVDDTSRFAGVARAMIDRHADHVCMDIADFRTTRMNRAVTRDGSVKAGRRTIKDDRSAIGDRSTYILGWNVEDRIDLARAELARTEKELARSIEIRDEFTQSLATMSTRRDKANQLVGAQVDFASVDVEGARRELASVEASIGALDTNEAGALRERRADAIRRQGVASTEKDRLNREKGSAEGTVKVMTGDMDRYRKRLDAEVAAHGPTTLKERLAYLMAMRKKAGVPPGASTFRHALVQHEADMDAFLADLRQDLERASNSEANIQRAANAAHNEAREFNRNFPELDLNSDILARSHEDGLSLSRAATIRSEWRAALEKLERDDLPRHEAAFEARRKTFAVEAIQEIQSQANNYARRIRKLEQGFNSILSGLVYDPMEGTRAKLRIHPRTENVAVQTFRAKLDRAVDVLYSEDTDLVERKVQDLIDDIRKNEDSTSMTDRRNAILDLRNWHTMDVEEYYANEDGEYAEQRRIYAGHDGASGGQGERLTMLLIGAAMSYTFGAGDDNRQVTGLQTIMLDEAFMHGSEEMAAAATDVLVAMGLQVIAATPVQKLQAFAGKTERVFSISKKKEQIVHTDTTYAALDEREKKETAALLDEIGAA